MDRMPENLDIKVKLTYHNDKDTELPRTGRTDPFRPAKLSVYP